MRGGWRRVLLPERVLSPRGLLVRAAVLVMVFAVLHLCGLREYTMLITGTTPDGRPANPVSMALAIMYMLAHLGTVVFAPVLALAALSWAAYLYLRAERG